MELHLYYRFTNNQGLENQISDLKSQMLSMNPQSAEYQYDKLQLEREKRTSNP
jgi:hypothetical protein